MTGPVSDELQVESEALSGNGCRVFDCLTTRTALPVVV